MDLASLQRRLAGACALNVGGCTSPHSVIALPSFNVSASLLAHYAGRIAPLEHRYLLAMLMLGRIPGAAFHFVTCGAPEADVLEYYFALLPESAQADARRRLTVTEVPEPGDVPVAAKLLSHLDLLVELRERLGDHPAFIEPWNVGVEEAAVALAVQAPIRGTLPGLRWLAFKSGGRRLCAAAGVPIAFGVEDVHDLDEVRGAINTIRRTRPSAAGVVVKLDDSVAGDGNVVIRAEDDLDAALDSVPDWYVADLAEGGIVEELITGAEFSSPSVQLDLEPDGRTVVLATHEQVLGGDTFQVFQGCRFPANPEYAAILASYGTRIGQQLIRRGALGRARIDFAAARDPDGTWRLYALEINLRKGGTTHPYSVLRNLVPGGYDATRGQWRAGTEATYCYECSDNLVDRRWTVLTSRAAITAVDAAGLTFDHRTRTGVVLHMLPGLRIDGRVGATAIAASTEEATELLAATATALSAAVAPPGRSTSVEGDHC